HRRMGHAYAPALHTMVEKGIITGVTLEDGDADFCAVCAQAKQTRETFPQEHSSPPAKRY
ncbi:hypothetical protein WOLCODRAFT_40744, partial [Wolfiporia cocos MD-104 SS10]